MMALFRIVEPSSGTVTIDGVDTSKIGLADLRSRLSLVPQVRAVWFGVERSKHWFGVERSKHRFVERLKHRFVKRLKHRFVERLKYRFVKRLKYRFGVRVPRAGPDPEHAE